MEDVIREMYTLKDTGEYGDYVTEVTVYHHKTVLKVYEESTYLSWGLLQLKGEPIRRPKTIGYYDNVRNAINKIIIEWEIPLYLRDHAQQTAGLLEIDFIEEIKKERMKKKLEEERTLNAMFTHWLEGQSRLTDGGIQPIEEQPMEQEPKRKMHINSLTNLPQYSHLKQK